MRPMIYGQARAILKRRPARRSAHEFVAERLKEIFEDYQVTKIAFYRSNWTHLRPWRFEAPALRRCMRSTRCLSRLAKAIAA